MSFLVRTAGSEFRIMAIAHIIEYLGAVMRFVRFF